MQNGIVPGLDRFMSEGLPAIRGARLGVCCHPAAVDLQLRGLPERLLSSGVTISRYFAPEHGLHGQLQDMESVTSTEPEVISLYGSTEESLRPVVSSISDLDVILFDLRDIGTRYYTFAATMKYMLETVSETDTRMIILDRPCPIGGDKVEGGIVQPGFDSFVGALPVSVRHGMTLGELARFMTTEMGISADVEIIPCSGWQRNQRHEQTGLPWVLPSPNMPSPETALIYPGMCLVEGTTLSEGRGTTLPFHLVGAPYLSGQEFADCATGLAKDLDLKGVLFRPVTFVPGIQKHRGETCHGIQVHVTSADDLHSLLLGMVVITAAALTSGSKFQWRTEEYEFVTEPIAIDLLWGAADFRETVDRLRNSGGDPAQALEGLLRSRESERLMFIKQRESCLLYP